MGLNETSVIARASAALSAAGAYDTPKEIDCSAGDQADIWVSYDQHASATAGKVTIKVETAVSIGGSDYWANARYVVLTGAFSGGADVSSQAQSEIVEFDPLSTGAEYIRLMLTDLNADKIRISVKESGEPSDPGTCAVYVRIKSS